MSKIKALVAALLLLLPVAVFAQNMQVKGVVTDKAGEPVPFASVMAKGTMIGASTDALGNYSITVDKNATLVFSYVGYESQEIPVAGRGIVNVVLNEDSESLDDVVVVAYGTAKRESVTGAISTVKSDDIAKRPLTSVTDVLEGMSTGVLTLPGGDPGESADIRIRGVGRPSSSGNSPLYVIDGVPFGGNISDLNPNDIESLTVLKDATSAALYGNRASNGVIIITTKRGKSDRVNLSVSVNQGIFNRAIPEYDRVDAKDFMQVFFNGYVNNLVSGGTASKEDAIADVRTNFMTYIGDYNVFNVANDALFSEKGEFNYSASILPGYDDLNWWKYAMRNGYRQDYNVSGSGASAKSNYYFSMGYLNEEGQTVASGFDRWTGRANVSVTPVDWLKAGVNVGASWQTQDERSTSETGYANPLYQAHIFAPIYPVYLHNTDGTYVFDEAGGKIYDDGDLRSRAQHIGRHSIWEAQLDKRHTQRITTSAQAFTDITFLKDFTLSIKGDVSLRNSMYRSYNNAIVGDGKGNNGRTSRTDYLYTNYTFQQLLNWHHSFGDHTFEVLVGHENFYYNYEYQYNYKVDETIPGGDELDNLNTMTTMSGYQSGYRLESYLSRAKYDYMNKYFLEGSFRRDGSSRFHKDNRWGNFWSVGATWAISRENFMKDVSWVDNLRYRISYGQVGNDAGSGYYGYMALYDLGAKYGGKAASYKTQNEAADLVWESENSFSTALEGRLFDRANFTIEYFNKVTKDLLFDVEHPTSVGGIATGSATTATTQNIGSVRNNGIEFSFDVDIIKKRDFVWNFGVNATWMKNTILKLPETDITNYDGLQNAMRNGTKLWAEGHGIYDWHIYQYAGVDMMTGRALYEIDDTKYYILKDNKTGDRWDEETKSMIHDYEKDVVPDNYAVVINGKEYVLSTTYAKRDWSGTALPKVYGSFNTGIRWKNFSMSALFTYQFGSKCLDYAYQDLMAVSTSPHAYHVDVLNAWTEAPSGMTEDSADRISTTAIPQTNGFWSSYSNATSTRFLVSGNYLIVKNVNLAYSLPRRLVNRLGVGGVTFSASVDNLWTFTARKGLNPQQNWSGLVYGSYVNTPRVSTVGVKVTL